MSIDFQASSSRQGKEFEDAVCTVLKIAGWAIIERCRKAHHAEIDIVALSPAGREWWIECKGSWGKRQQGASSSDTAKKAVGVAWMLSLVEGRPPYLLVTSHLPNESTSTNVFLTEAVRCGLFTDVVCMSDLHRYLMTAS